MCIKKYNIVLFLLVLFYVSAYYTTQAQTKLTIEDFTEKRVLTPNSIHGINWMEDGNYYTQLKENMIVKFSIKERKEVSTILDGDKILDGKKIQSYTFNKGEGKILLQYDKKNIYRRSYTAKHYLYDRNTKKLIKISDFPHQSYAKLSPDGKKIGFTYKNNLYYVNIDKPEKSLQITLDGSINKIINGSTDWVYEEEFGISRAFDWSEDSKMLAYLRFDESEVKEYNMQKWSSKSTYPVDYKFKYPKPGEKNAVVTVHMYDLNTNKSRKINLKNANDLYIPRLKWTPSANILSIITLNRLQNHLEIIHIDSKTNTPKTIITFKEDTYVDLYNPIYINAKNIIVMSEETGFKHLYLYDYQGEKIKNITGGNWDVSYFIGINPNNTTIYYTSKEASPLESQLYSININGKKKKRITNTPGTHSINMSPDTKYFLDYFTNTFTPLEVYLYDTKKLANPFLLEDNKEFKEKIAKYKLPKKELLTITLSDNTILNAYMLKPTNFDMNKKYPLMIYQYSGPKSQAVSNSFERRGFNYLLTQAGYIVAVIDPRGTGGRGKKFASCTYGQLGKLESEDLIEATHILGYKNYIDSSRVGIWGWSYGGYMSSLATFKGKKTFKAAIAVAPVTNWRYYDTIYTERYLKTPQLNPSGYDDNSPINHADKLESNFLLIHGTGDDNVHFQNSIILQEALIKAQKQFQTFYYPNLAHSLSGYHARTHLYTLMFNFIKNNL